MSGQAELDEIETFITDYDLADFEHIVDERSTVWSLFGVSAQPSFVFINDNGEIARQIGALPDGTLDDVLEQLAST